jgi:hypothetical protein
MKKTGSYIYTDAWKLLMNNGYRCSNYKGSNYYVRPVLAL